MLILADTWRQNGFDIQGSVLPAAQAQEKQPGGSWKVVADAFNSDLPEAGAAAH